MWRTWLQWLMQRLANRSATEEAPPRAAEQHVPPEPVQAEPKAEDEPWPFGHHIPPTVEAEVQEHRGEWET